MKQNLIILLLALLLAGAEKASAQTATIVSSVLPAEVRKTVNIKAVRDFRKQSGSPADENWSITSDGGWVASFEANNVKHMQFYTAGGVWQCHELVYTEEHLPYNVAEDIRRNFDEYKINNIAELELPTDHVYFINIHNKDNTRFKTIQWHNGDWQVTKAFENQR
ncbi:hypothetical protein [Deminuibacter soli]|uniref:Beta-lactamase-inhibitor-like PepSY-like domain-containing protein n=1 Tax=Deminuibacter soli TaxID=2291815 RepID=A0A3E1NDJ7_9BACT|nr:hypothetical protein [Deminuibacter soli]RFM25838.1 hypothetical protein DXN05_23035 [Deminuibacter soli]